MVKLKKLITIIPAVVVVMFMIAGISNCHNSEGETPTKETNCHDNKDNDADGATDCGDYDCYGQC